MSTNTVYTMFDHPICALATPYASSALAIVRVTGNDSIRLLSSICKNPKRLVDSPSNVAIVHHLFEKSERKHDTNTQSPSSKEVPLDTAMIIPYYAPHSFTGQEGADISIHGSLAGIRRLLRALYRAGFDKAEPGEFTKRAFLNGKLDLSQSEAIHEVIQAQNESSHIEALEKMGGSVFAYVDAIKQKLVRLVATCSVALDYPEDEIQESTEIHITDIVEALAMIDIVLGTYDFAQLKKANIRVVLAGTTNVGKSSLFNVLLKQDRAIVSEVHGTTRDFLEQELMVKDISLILFDTAGIRDIILQKEETPTKTHVTELVDIVSVEDEGIRRSRELVEHAHVIMYVFDAKEGWTAQDTELLERLGYHMDSSSNNSNKNLAKLLFIANKSDLVEQDQEQILQNKKTNTIKIPKSVLQHGQVISCSVKQYHNIVAVQEALYACIVSDISIPNNDVPLISSLRQKLALEESKEVLQQVLYALQTDMPLDMISLDVDIAMKALGTITGEVTREDILDTIFSQFCVGK